MDVILLRCRKDCQKDRSGLEIFKRRPLIILLGINNVYRKVSDHLLQNVKIFITLQL